MKNATDTGVNNTERTEPVDKLQELILFIAQRSEGDANFGKVKLNKLLFFADFQAFRLLGESITGAKYVRKELGPVPDKIKAAMAHLVTEKRLVVRESRVTTYTQHRPIALADANLDAFTAAQIALVTEILERYRDMNATQISEASHEFLAWQMADAEEEIPYHAIMLGKMTATAEDRAYATSLL